MNLRSALVLLVILGLLAGCVPVTSIPTTETATAAAPITATHIAIPTRPETAIPMSPFPSSTPQPWTPTVTPTFDPSTIVTVTPAQAAVCPKVNPLFLPGFPSPKYDDYNTLEHAVENVLTYLNQGGSIDNAAVRFGGGSKWFKKVDLTGDSVPDVAIISPTPFGTIYFLTCQNGKYIEFSQNDDSNAEVIGINRIDQITDLNKNGISETIVTSTGCSGSGCLGISVFEWNGEKFVDLAPKVGTLGPHGFSFKDTNNDGLKEIVLKGDSPGSCCIGMMMPWRYKNTIYSWSGKIFTETYVYFDSPQYRFQAIQDADHEIQYKHFDKALDLYQDAIFSDKLEWWSRERRDYEVNLFYNSYKQPNPTPSVYPAEDVTEYPRLAAYAYFRIVLLHILQGHETDAGTVYQTLQQRFPEGNPGFPYAEMASAFWNEYQASHDMTAACGMAVEYAAAHPDILIPLGSDYHGMQSHTYQPEDVCPFR